MPYLLKGAIDAFKQSGDVVWTSPTVAQWTNERWTQADFDALPLHDCVRRRSAGSGKVLEDVWVTDFHEIMGNLISNTATGSLDDL